MNAGLRIKQGLLLLLVGLQSTLGSISSSAAPQSIPSVPAGLKATPGNSWVSLTWSAVPGATSYHLKRATNSGGPYSLVASPVSVVQTDSGLKNGTTYFYVVSAVGAGGESANSSQISAKPAASTAVQTPTTPTGLTATPGNSWASLTWGAVPGATSYRLKRATTSGGPYAQIAAPVSTGHTDGGLRNGTTYYYVISAVGSVGQSPNSAQISVKLGVQTSASVTPTVTSVTVSPSSSTTTTNSTLQFTATVHGTTSNTGVSWKSSVGSITSAGVYTAPAVTENATITATSNADSTKSAAATVAVTAPPPPPVVTAPVPSTLFSQTVTWPGVAHFPTVQFGSLRLWDTGTTWSEMETSRGSYSWTTLDTWLSVAATQQKDVLYTFGRTPQWASLRPTEACAQGYVGCAAPPSDVDSGDATFKAFVTALVKHSLASPTARIKYYEVWNEANGTKYWTGTFPQLATMANDAYAIIHSLDPDALVVGPAPTGSNTVQWLSSYYAAGATKAQDIVALHTYLTAKTDPPAIATRVSDLRAMMTSHGIGDEPIWSTEGGFGILPYTSSQQVATVGQLYTMLWSKDVDRFYWFAWDSSNNWGTMWTSAGGVNPPGVAYGVLYDWLVGSTHSPNPCSQASDGTWSCSLTLSTGYPAQIVWNATTSKTIGVNPSFTTYQTLANTTTHSIAGNQVAIGNEPILIVKNSPVQ